MPSTLNGATIRTIELTYPSFGDWTADLTLEAGASPVRGASVALVVGSLALSGVVERAGDDAPERPHLVVVGAPGWASLIGTPMSYQSDAQVRLATVLADLSRASGQVIEQPTDADIGGHYEVIAASPGDPARYRDALDDLAEAGLLAPWRMDPDGVTRFGARAGVEVKSRATVLRKGSGVGRVVYGIDSPRDFLPGNTVGGVPIARVVITESSGNLEAEVYTLEPNAAPSMRASIQRMVWRRTQEILRTYVVADVLDDKRLDLVPPPDAPHLPEMRAVPVWTLGGAKVTPAAGTEVLVMFRDRRRTQPVALAFAPGTPDEVRIDADSIVLPGSDTIAPGTEYGRFVRYGDTIVVPVGSGAVPTELVLVASIAPPHNVTVSKASS